jgi:hypothetical protein
VEMFAYFENPIDMYKIGWYNETREYHDHHAPKKQPMIKKANKK